MKHKDVQMRRKDREIQDKSAIHEILQKADTCRIALNTGEAPYIVPLNYGFVFDDAFVLYFHCANEGRKLELIDKDGSAGFEIDTEHELVTAEDCCGWGMRYSSIIGAGVIERVKDAAEKKLGLDLLMRHYGFAGDTAYPDAMLNQTTVLRMCVNQMSAKRRG